MSSGKWRPFCLGLNVFIAWTRIRYPIRHPFRRDKRQCVTLSWCHNVTGNSPTVFFMKWYFVQSTLHYKRATVFVNPGARFSTISCYIRNKVHLFLGRGFFQVLTICYKHDGWLGRHNISAVTAFLDFSVYSISSITLYPKKYAHGFCFAVLCCGYTLTGFPISIRLTSLALWQSNDCPSASKATLINMDKYFIWIHYERLHNHNKAKHNKTVCIVLGIYCR